ncbi:MAG TPA: hypothetical protein VIA18_11540, partial [Polyangia bacterium]|nr:hypothetical protein [Polyangia bacterium]
MKTLLVMLALLLAAASTLRADETPADPDALYDGGWYEAALEGYAASARRARDDHAYVRALMGALKSEMLLTRRAEALARGRAARLPADVGLRAVVEIERLQLFISLAAAYGFADDKAARASPAPSPARPSRAAAVRDAEAAAQLLWRDRQALARLPLGRMREFFALDQADLSRFPTVWDFAVVRLALYLRMRHDTGRPTVDLLAEDVPRDFAGSRSLVDRLAALFEESSRLDGGAVDRKSAAERWKVDRVLLGIPSGDESKALRPRAIALLRGWAHAMATPLGRADAALQAATLLNYEDQPIEAEMLVEPALAETPRGMLAEELRGLLAELRNCTFAVSTRVTPDGKTALRVRARNVPKLYLRLYRLDPLRDLHHELSYANPQLSFQLVDRLTKTLPVLASWSAALGDAGDRRSVERDLDVPAPGLGLYLLLASDGADFAYSRSIVTAAMVSVMDVATARVRTGDAVRYYAFDAASGAPAAKVPFRLMVAEKRGQPVEERVVTDADGVA